MALNVYVALCYCKLDYYDVSLEVGAQTRGDGWLGAMSNYPDSCDGGIESWLLQSKCVQACGNDRGAGQQPHAQYCPATVILPQIWRSCQMPGGRPSKHQLLTHVPSCTIPLPYCQTATGVVQRVSQTFGRLFHGCLCYVHSNLPERRPIV